METNISKLLSDSKIYFSPIKKSDDVSALYEQKQQQQGNIPTEKHIQQQQHNHGGGC